MNPNPSGCREYEQLTRRGMFHAAQQRALDLAPKWLPNVTYAAEPSHSRRFPTDRDIVVSIYLRGGCDGLTMCVPYGDAAYYRHRSSLAVPRPDQTTNANRGIDLNGYFALPRAMGAIKEIYDAGHFLIVHGTGSTDPTRSHFDAQQFMEAGKPDKGLWTGWLGRHLSSTTEMVPNSLLRAIGLSGLLALTLEGGPKATAFSSLTDYRYGGRSETETERVEWIRQAYESAPAALREAAQNTVRTVDLLRSVDYENYTPQNGAVYNPALPSGGGTYGPANDFGQSMRATAALIKKDVGVEAVHIDMGGWDTHEYQSPFEDYGAMSMLMYGLSTNLKAFFLDMEGMNLMSKVTVVIVSEFGRTVQQNGAAGTDHGHGNVVMLMGKNVNGGQVMTNWPGLDESQLFEQNALRITIDYRDILAEVVQKRLGNSNLGFVFPTYTPTFRNAVRQI